MGVGANYRSRNPYTHSDASYYAAVESGNAKAEELSKKIAELESVIKDMMDANPDPKKYRILDYEEYGSLAFAISIEYPNCKNQKGLKILVYQGKVKDLIRQGEIDPHFGDGEMMFPFARFKPTPEGWHYAKELAKELANG